MADDRLRTLGREAANDPLVRARWLGERLRAGELDERRLQLAAFLGDAAALAIVAAPPEPPADLVVWAQLLSGFGRDVAVRAARAAAAARLPGPANPVDEAALAAVDAWLPCPCETHREAAAMTAGPDAPTVRRSLAGWAAAAAGARSATGAAHAAVLTICGGRDDYGALVRDVDAALDARVRESIGAELLAWALGEGRQSAGPAPRPAAPVEDRVRAEHVIDLWKLEPAPDAEEALESALRTGTAGPSAVQGAVARIVARGSLTDALEHRREDDRLRHLAATALRRNLPWSNEGLAWALATAALGPPERLPLAGLLRAAAALAGRLPIAPVLRAAVELHIVRGRDGLLGPMTPAVAARLARLLKDKRELI